MTRIVIALSLLWLSACGGGGRSMPDRQDPPASGGTDGVMATIDQWGLWAAWAGGGLLLLSAIAIVLLPARRALAYQGMVLGGCLIACGYCLAWLAAHEWVVVLVILSAGLLLAWGGRNWIERRLQIDIDRDGDIGVAG